MPRKGAPEPTDADDRFDDSRHPRRTLASNGKQSSVMSTEVRDGREAWRTTPFCESARQHVGAGWTLAARAFAQTQRCGSAEPRQPRDDRIPGERSSRRASSWRCLWRRSIRMASRRTGSAARQALARQRGVVGSAAGDDDSDRPVIRFGSSRGVRRRAWPLRVGSWMLRRSGRLS
jgi:hypothetical protein